MPTYCYETDEGKIIEKTFHMGDAPAFIPLEGGAVANRCYRAEQKATTPTRGWPLECIASGVNPDQAGELRTHFKELGIPTEVSNDGNPIYRSAGHRKRALKARGFHDRQSFS